MNKLTQKYWKFIKFTKTQNRKGKNSQENLKMIKAYKNDERLLKNKLTEIY